MRRILRPRRRPRSRRRPPSCVRCPAARPCVPSSSRSSADSTASSTRTSPEPEPRAGRGRHRGQGVRPQPRRDAHAQGRVGRGRRGQRHRVRRLVEVLPRRRVPGRRQGGGADGRARPDHQRQLRRIHPRAGARTWRSSSPTCPGPTSPRSRDLRHRLDLPVPQPGDQPRGRRWSSGARPRPSARRRSTWPSNAGAKVIATTRSRDRFAMLEKLGAERAEVEGPDLSKRIAEAKQIDAVLDLVGNSTILDSLAMLRRGRPRLPGRLAGRPRADRRLQPAAADGQRRLPDLLRQLRVRDAGLPALRRAAAGDRASRWRRAGCRPKPSRVFRFEEIREAHRVMEADEAGGKMVVVLD